MPKIGDRVQVTIRGPANLSGTVTLSGGQVAISGIIVGEEGDQWTVKLDVSFDGRNLIRVPKSVLVQA